MAFVSTTLKHIYYQQHCFMEQYFAGAISECYDMEVTRNQACWYWVSFLCFCPRSFELLHDTCHHVLMDHVPCVIVISMLCHTNSLVSFKHFKLGVIVIATFCMKIKTINNSEPNFSQVSTNYDSYLGLLTMVITRKKVWIEHFKGWYLENSRCLIWSSTSFGGFRMHKHVLCSQYLYKAFNRVDVGDARYLKYHSLIRLR